MAEGVRVRSTAYRARDPPQRKPGWIQAVQPVQPLQAARPGQPAGGDSPCTDAGLAVRHGDTCAAVPESRSGRFRCAAPPAALPRNSRAMSQTDPRSTAAAPASDADITTLRLLATARDLALSLHARRRIPLQLTLDSTLDRDLGLDSLGRVELLLRLERAFGIHLGEQILGDARTLRDLLDAVRQAEPAAPPKMTAEPFLAPGPAEPVPATARTLPEVLDWHAAHHPQRPHIHLEETDDRQEIISYGTLREQALRVAGGLRRLGLVTGDPVAIMLPTSSEFFPAFFGTLYAGCVPVPIYPPFRPSQIEEHLRRQAAILSNARARLLITTEERRGVGRLVRGLARSLHSVATVEELSASGTGSPVPLAPHDVALIQYTSGSTADPKGVVLTHANLLANIRAIGEAMAVSSSDIFVSWLPLYHDMGLIGAWLGSLYFAVPVVIASPLRFLARPEHWLWTIHRYRATLSAAPNFAYELCLRKIDDASIVGLDLGSWRMAINGAEPVSPDTVRGFAARFARYGFRPETMTPVYGLAECSVGLSFPPPGRMPVIDRIERDALARTATAVPAPPGDATALEVVACGHALPGHEVRIVDASGRELENRREGRLQFRGPSTTAGYLRNPAATAALIRDGWMESGDLAYIASGDIFLTGRSKDIIIRAGRNIYPQELENAIGNLPGVRRGCVVAFGSHDRLSGTERLIIVAETKLEDDGRRAVLQRQIEDLAASLLDTPADDVILAPAHTVLKTSSGKIRRSASRQLYESGRLGAHPPPVWWQAARLYWASLGGRFRRTATEAAALLYAASWWALLCTYGFVAWTLVATLPGRERRWGAVHTIARMFLRSAAIPFRETGIEHIPRQGAVLTANHSSYFDGVVLAALLRHCPTFIVKRELTTQFVAGTFLRRLGALFADRAQPSEGVQSSTAALAAARSGQTLVFFPEGTLTRIPGLLPFHTGAFYVAALSGSPVVPISIRGTRSVLRGDQWFPRHAAIEVDVAPAISAAGDDWTAVVKLRDAARDEILRRTGEPDLYAQNMALSPHPAPPR